MSHLPVRALGPVALAALALVILAACSVEVSTGNSQVVITVDDEGDVTIGHEGTGSAMHSTVTINGRTELNLEASTFGGDPIADVTGEAEHDDAGGYRITLNVNAQRPVDVRIDGLAQVRIESADQSRSNPAELSAGEHELTITGSR